MADNLTTQSATPATVPAASVIATDDVAGVHYQRMKLVDGTLDSTTAIVAGEGVKANALRVVLPTDAADVKVTLDGESVPVTGTFYQATQPVSGTVSVSGQVQIGDGTDAIAVSTAAADAESNSVNRLEVEGYNMVFNGTTWDRCRGSVNKGMIVQPASDIVRVQVTPTIDTAAYTSGDCIGGLMAIANAARFSGGSGTILGITLLDKTQAQRAAIDLLFFDRSVTVAGNNAAVAMSDADMAFCLGIVPVGPYNTAFPGTPLNSLSTLLNVGLPFVLNGTSLYCQAVVRATPTYVASTDLTFSFLIQRD